MDTLSWLKVNPDLKIEVTTKSFYGKYLYRVKLFAPGFRLCTRLSHISEYELRKKVRAELLYSRVDIYWPHIRETDPKQIVWLVKKLSSHADVLSIRTEDPHLTIYSNDELLLYDIASTCPQPKTRTLAFTRPGEDMVDDLRNDTMFLKKGNGFKYKVLTREGVKTPLESQQQLKSYLDSLGKEVMVSRSFYRSLSVKGWLPSGHIFHNDEGLLLFFKMLAPSLIAKVYNIKVLRSDK